MNDTETTPSGLQPVTDEVELALGQVASRLKEISGSLRAGQLRFRGMSEPERAAFARNAAARLRQVEHYAQFAATLFEEEFVDRPRQMATATPDQLPAIRARPASFLRATKLLGAVAAVLGAALGIWRAISGSH